MSSRSNSFDPGELPQEIWVDLIVNNDFSFQDLFRFGLVCHYFSQVLKSPQIQSLKLKKKTGQYEGHGGVVYTVRWSPDGIFLASSSGDGTIRIWNTITGKESKRLEFSGTIFSVDWHPYRKWLLFGGANQSGVWDLTKNTKKDAMIHSFESTCTFVKISPNGELLAMGGNPSIIVRNCETGRSVREFPITNHNNLLFDQTSRFVVSTNLAYELFIWDVETGETKMDKQFSSFVIVTFGQDNTLFAMSYKEEQSYKVRVYGFEKEWKRLRTFSCSEGGFNICVSIDSKFLFYSDNNILVYNTFNKKKICEITEHNGWIKHLSLSPDGNFLAASLQEGFFYVYDIRSYVK